MFAVPSRFLLLVCLLCLCFSSVFGAGTASSPQRIAHYRQTVQECQETVKNWEREADLQLGFVISVIVFGAAITVIQALGRGWSKTTTIVLGACTSILTGVNARVFSADYRVLEQSAIDAHGVIEQLDIVIDALISVDSQPERNDLESQWLKLLDQFRVLQKRLLQNQNIGPSTILTTAYAQSSAGPAWINTTTSQDVYSFYFVGHAEDRSITAAQKRSFDDAVEVGRREIWKTDADPDATRKFVAASSAVDATWFRYDKAEKLYRYYTRLRLNKEVQNFKLVGMRTAEVIGILDATINADTSVAAVVDHSGRAYLWSILSSSKLQDLQCLSPVVAIGFSQDGTKLFGITKDHSLQTWDGRTGKALTNAVLQLADPLRGAEIGLRGNVALIASGSSSVAGCCITVWSTSPVRQIASMPTGNKVELTSSGDASHLAAVLQDGTIQIFSLPSVRVIARSPRLGRNVHGISCSFDCARIIVGADTTAKLIDGTLGTIVDELGHPTRVSSVAISQDAQRIATADLDNTIRVWDPPFKEPTLRLKDHRFRVNLLRFSLDGSRLIGADEDGNITIYSFSEETGVISRF